MVPDPHAAGYTILIRDNHTDETRTVRFQSACWNEPAPYGQESWWTEGNGGCDCNRAIFFAEAGGQIDPDQPCGSTRFSCLAVLSDGRRIALDPIAEDMAYDWS